MKCSAAALLLSLAAPAARAGVVILDKELNPAYSLFDPMDKGEMVGKEDCNRVYGEAIHAKLPYVTGVNVECVPGTYGCDAIHPPHYGGTDRWLVTDIIVPFEYGDEEGGEGDEEDVGVSVRGAASKAGKERKSPRTGVMSRCPGHDETPAKIKKSLGVQFYRQDDRSKASLPAFLSRMDESRGEIEERYAVYRACVKVPIYCMNQQPGNFKGWTGISFQNRPLVEEDCEGDLEFYVDSIEIASRCPFNVENNEDLDSSFCRDVGRSANNNDDSLDDWDYRGVCEDKPAEPFASALVAE